VAHEQPKNLANRLKTTTSHVTPKGVQTFVTYWHINISLLPE